MKSLINETSLRHLKLIEILYYHDNWMPIKELATYADCSDRIIRIDIKTINSLFSPFEILLSSRKGLYLNTPHQIGIQHIYKIILSESLEFQLIELVFFNPGINTSVISDKLFISSSTVTRLIQRCNKYLLNYQMKISRSPFKIVGNELAIRLFFFNYLKEKYSLQSIPFPIDSIKAFQRLVIEVTNKRQQTLSFFQIEFVSFLFIVVVTRLKSQNHLKIPPQEMIDHPLFHALRSNTDYASMFERTLKLPWNDDTVNQLIFIFFTNKFFFTFQDLQIASNLNPEIKETLSKLSIFLKLLSHKLKVSMINEEFILLTLYNYHHFFIGNDFILFNKRQAFKDLAIKEYPELMSELTNQLKNFKFHSKFEWSPTSFNETIFIIISHWENLLVDIQKTLLPISILISATFESDHAKLLKSSLLLQSDAHIHVSLSKSATIDALNEESLEYDLVISNTTNLIINHPNVVQVNPILIARDWNNLSTIFSTIRQTKLQKRN